MHIVQEILGYFLIGLMGIPVLAVLYLPVWFILRKKVPFWRQIAYFLFGVCAAVILFATVLDVLILNIMSGRELIFEVHSLNLVPFKMFTETWIMGAEKQFTQIIANVLMFVPMGFITPVAFGKARTFKKTVLSMAVFSFLIEFVQYFIGRSSDIDDFILNVMGGMLGYGIFSLFLRLFGKKKICKEVMGTGL